MQSKHATAEDFQRWQDRAKEMTLAQLNYSMRDARDAADAVKDHDPVKSNYYRDEMLTYADEIRRRKA